MDNPPPHGADAGRVGDPCLRIIAGTVRRAIKRSRTVRLPGDGLHLTLDLPVQEMKNRPCPIGQQVKHRSADLSPGPGVPRVSRDPPQTVDPIERPADKGARCGETPSAARGVDGGSVTSRRDVGREGERGPALAELPGADVRHNSSPTGPRRGGGVATSPPRIFVRRPRRRALRSTRCMPGSRIRSSPAGSMPTWRTRTGQPF